MLPAENMINEHFRAFTLTGETVKNDRGHEIDGHSLKPLLQNPQLGEWTGSDAALTALYKWRLKYDPLAESYSLRSHDWRYIRYENGKEELYQTQQDPYEWTNLADAPEQAPRIKRFRQQLASRLPQTKTPPPQPKKQLKPKPQKSPPVVKNAEYWKNQHFRKHPEADTDGDGKLNWPEFKAHKAKLEMQKSGKDK